MTDKKIIAVVVTADLDDEASLVKAPDPATGPLLLPRAAAAVRPRPRIH